MVKGISFRFGKPSFVLKKGLSDNRNYIDSLSTINIVAEKHNITTKTVKQLFK